jgi:hypothetical protein
MSEVQKVVAVVVKFIIHLRADSTAQSSITASEWIKETEIKQLIPFQ